MSEIELKKGMEEFIRELMKLINSREGILYLIKKDYRICQFEMQLVSNLIKKYDLNYDSVLFTKLMKCYEVEP